MRGRFRCAKAGLARSQLSGIRKTGLGLIEFTDKTSLKADFKNMNSYSLILNKQLPLLQQADGELPPGHLTRF
jgi:hypothetical protein